MIVAFLKANGTDARTYVLTHRTPDLHMRAVEKKKAE